MLKPCEGMVRVANLCLRPTYAGYQYSTVWYEYVDGCHLDLPW